jgi:hypothetical protein
MVNPMVLALVILEIRQLFGVVVCVLVGESNNRKEMKIPDPAV